MTTPEGAIDVINGLFGAHGCRALHAKGSWCSGTFTATEAARGLSRAAHLQGDPIPVLARLSNAGGNPHVPDFAPDLRGLAVSFELPDGSRTDLVAVNMPRFGSATPEEFLDLIRAGTGRAAVWRTPAYMATHPRALALLPRLAGRLRPPASYGVTDFNTIHAYRWLAADGSARHTRCRWISEQPGDRLSLREARRRGRDYLQEELAGRLAGDGLRWRLEAQIAGAGDDVDDPSRTWPDDRERVTVGTLHLTAIEPDPEAGGGIVVMDPTRVTDGIELTDDPVLRFRGPVYSASVERRAG